MSTLWRHPSLGLFVGMLLGMTPLSAAAEAITALTVQNQLLFFDSSNPSTVTSVNITGLLAGDSLVGIDRRASLGPNNGILYGLSQNGTSGRIYTLNETTGVASPGFVLAADPADATAPFPYTTLLGTQFGIDFNPTVDRLRVTSDLGQNLRINVDNGLVQLDVPLAYQVGDPNFGATPSVVGVAYSNNFGGATSTVLRGVDIARTPDALVVHAVPNGGTLTTAFGVPYDAQLLSYDISGITGTAYISVNNQLFATGPGGVNLVGTIGSGTMVQGIAAGVGRPVPEPASFTLLALGVAGLLRARRRRA